MLYSDKDRLCRSIGLSVRPVNVFFSGQLVSLSVCDQSIILFLLVSVLIFCLKN